MGVCFTKNKNETMVRVNAANENIKLRQNSKIKLNNTAKKSDSKENIKKEIDTINSTSKNKQNSVIINNIEGKSNFNSENKISKDEKLFNQENIKLDNIPNKEKEISHNIEDKFKRDNKILKVNDSIEKLMNTESDENKRDDKFLFMREINKEPLFNLADFYVNSNYEYSTDIEWSNILKRAKSQNKTLLAGKILNLKERKWNKENIMLSDVLKR